MNTNHLKKFAQAARKLLMEDVSKRLLYWGIGGDGEVVDELTRTSGGYIFRGDVYNDQSIPDKWNALVSAIKQHSLEDVIEEAAYTWFNRIIAIKILEKNGYDPEVLAYVSEELSDPVLLQNAKKGILPSTDSAIVADLKEAVLISNDEELFSQLLIHHCKSHHLLNNIFGHINDYTELLIPQTLLSKGGLLELINSEESISSEDYGEVELIGWLYQFYISDKKDEVFAGFKKKKKARAEDIPAATQIFTPKWIVKYLVENTVGRIWLDLHPESPIRETMKYLVEPENPIQDDPIIQDVKELKVLDPAVGSGHFLVVAFDLLMQMYQEEGYTKRKAVQSIIANNLFGLDICPRAVGLANFAILLKVAEHNADILATDLRPNIHAMPEPFDFQRKQIQDFLGEGSDEDIDEVHSAVKLLKRGQNIGSALILKLSVSARSRVLEALSKIAIVVDLDSQMNINRLVQYLQITNILTDHYPAVVANPPYMGQRNMNGELKQYVTESYPLSKNDLMTVFLTAGRALTVQRGRIGFLTLHSWMFTSTYSALREDLIENNDIESLLHIGRGLFGSDSGTAAFCIKVSKYYGSIRLYKKLFIKEVNVDQISVKKERFFDSNFGVYLVNQRNFARIPGYSIAYWLGPKMLAMFDLPSAGDHIDARVGLLTSDNKRFLRMWYEVSMTRCGFNLTREQAQNSERKWFPYNKGGKFRKWYGNQEYLINWQNDGEEIIKTVLNKYPYLKGSTTLVIKEFNPYFQESVSWTDLSWTVSGRYYPKGSLFDIAGHSTFYSSDDELLGTLAYINTAFTDSIAKVINSTFHFQVGDFKKIPYPQKFIDEADKSLIQECVEITTSDWDSNEMSWDFKRSPILNGYNSLPEDYAKWRVTTKKYTDILLRNELQLNELFNSIYELEEELNPEIPLDKITLNCNPHYRYAEKQTSNEYELLLKCDIIREVISYAFGCFMGRYRLDKPGLNIAHPNPSTQSLVSYIYNDRSIEIDDDAIIPMMGAGSPFSDDIVQRVQQFVLMVWGEESYTENLNFINEALGEDLEKFLTKKFWDFHKKMYKKRPIYWQFASPGGAFKVLTYMHRMNRFTVQVIRKNYLFKQMNWLEREMAPLAENEATLHTKESKRLDKLRKDLIECREYDLLLKDMADRQIEFDLDDGVVENYKLFEGVVSKI